MNVFGRIAILPCRNLITSDISDFDQFLMKEAMFIPSLFITASANVAVILQMNRTYMKLVYSIYDIKICETVFEL